MIRQNGGWDNFSMIKIEDIECESTLDAHNRERELVEQYGNGMNHRVPSRTAREYREDNKEQISEYKKQKFKCECGGVSTYRNKAQHLRSQKHQNYVQRNNTLKDFLGVYYKMKVTQAQVEGFFANHEKNDVKTFLQNYQAPVLRILVDCLGKNDDVVKCLNQPSKVIASINNNKNFKSIIYTYNTR